jgi:hypothetical protein
MTPRHVPTPSRVGAVPSVAPVTRAKGGAGTLLARVALLLAVAALPVAFNAWIDPARLVAPRQAEREIARVLAAGSNVTDVANYDDRAIERHLAPMRARAAELVLGSSRMQPLRGCGGAELRGCGKSFVNGAMQGAVLDDMLGVYGLYDAAGRRPRRVLLGVDPWTESWTGTGAWVSLAAEREMVMRRAGIPASPTRERAALLAARLRTLVTPEYFRLAVYSFRRYGVHGIPWRATDRAQNAEKTRLPEGALVWPEVTSERATEAAHAFATGGIVHDERFRDLAHRTPGREGALERFVSHLESEGVGVTVVLVPFAPEVYDAALRLPGSTIVDVERELRAMAARTRASVVGSYDPRVVGVTTADFFDESHLRPEALARLVGR